MKMRVVARVITYNAEDNEVLLVKSRNQDFWYPPGGGWHYEQENIIECAEREVLEETGLKVKILKLIYVQEFHDTPDSVFFETFWIAEPIENTKLDDSYVDRGGDVETAKWFTREESENLKVFPKRLQNTFWNNIEEFLQREDPFIGIN